MIEILRLGHRPERDQRITTHCALVSRAFGARGIWIDRHDERIEETIKDVCRRFGGEFRIESGIDWQDFVEKWKEGGGVVAHLTMYGIPLKERLSQLRQAEKLLLVVGAEKVPGQVYQVADYNISVTNQPQSEVAALAVALDRITEGLWETLDFEGKVKIVPQTKGKKVIKKA
jgi:tRNA (cytidine56-2'-O)-methyltransferase